MMTSAESAEGRHLRRKHSELGEIQLSDDTEHMKRDVNNASRRPEGKMESSLQKFEVNAMQKREKVMQKTNDTIPQSVGVQPQGMKHDN